MARLSDIPEWERAHHLDKIATLPNYGVTPYVAGPPLNQRRVAIITTAGLHVLGDRPFEVGSADYRVIPGDAPASDVVMSHVSVNYDRTGFQEDINVVFPLARLRELQAAGEIGSISDFHYSFMGASQGHTLESKAREMAGLMKRDRVDAVLLSPV
jgi:D-proline reductase (dithiol) PrdB